LKKLSNYCSYICEFWRWIVNNKKKRKIFYVKIFVAYLSLVVDIVKNYNFWKFRKKWKVERRGTNRQFLDQFFSIFVFIRIVELFESPFLFHSILALLDKLNQVLHITQWYHAINWIELVASSISALWAPPTYWHKTITKCC
jgi:hypothetical protein